MRKVVNPVSDSCPGNFADSSTQWPKIDPHRPIFISPWNNNTSQQHQEEQQHQQQQQRGDVEKPSTTTPNSVHPFARRTKSRTFVEQKNLFSTSSTSTDSSEEPPKLTPDIWDESFEEIIRTANRSIETAESILSTLRRGDADDVETTPDVISKPDDNQVMIQINYDWKFFYDSLG